MARWSQTDFPVLRSVVGCSLRGLARDQYLFNGSPDTTGDGSLELRLDSRTILLYLASDGESVRADATESKIIPAFTLDGNLCAWERVELEQDPVFGNLIGRTVSKIEAIIEVWTHGMEVVTGWVVRFDGGDFLAYLNAGDEARLLLNHIPPHDNPDAHRRIDVLGEQVDVESRTGD